MSQIVFQQDPQLGSEKFILNEANLVVIGGVGLSQRKTIGLTDISSEFDSVKRRLKRFYLVPIFLAGLSGAVSWVLLLGDTSVIKAIVAGILAFMALIFLLLMRFEAVEAVRFYDKQRHVLFEISRPNKAAYRYDEFVGELVSRIQACKSARAPND